MSPLSTSSATPGPDSNFSPAAPSAPPVLSQDELDRALNFTLDLQAGLFSQASAYHQIVIGAGYAGAFALWGLVRENLSPFASLWIALMFGFSLSAFIAWNVFSMIWMAQERLLNLAATEGKTGLDVLTSYQKADRATLRRYRDVFLPMWRWQLPITIGPALIGFAVLVGNTITRLLTQG